MSRCPICKGPFDNIVPTFGKPEGHCLKCGWVSVEQGDPITGGTLEKINYTVKLRLHAPRTVLTLVSNLIANRRSFIYTDTLGPGGVEIVTGWEGTSDLIAAISECRKHFAARGLEAEDGLQMTQQE